MSEEEIIKVLKQVIEPVDIEHMSFYEIYKDYVPLPKLNEAIQGLLDLYQKEKEKNKNWEKIYDEDQQHITNLNNRIFDLEADNKKLDKENQGLFELYNFNDTSLLAKILKDYKKEIKKLTPSPTNPIPLEKQTNIWVNKKDYISKDKVRDEIKRLELEIKYNEECLKKLIEEREKSGSESEIDNIDEEIERIGEDIETLSVEIRTLEKLLEERN